jgi:hypothetical protein
MYIHTQCRYLYLQSYNIYLQSYNTPVTKPQWLFTILQCIYIHNVDIYIYNLTIYVYIYNLTTHLLRSPTYFYPLFLSTFFFMSISTILQHTCYGAPLVQNTALQAPPRRLPRDLSCPPPHLLIFFFGYMVRLYMQIICIRKIVYIDCIYT